MERRADNIKAVVDVPAGPAATAAEPVATATAANEDDGASSSGFAVAAFGANECRCTSTCKRLIRRCTWHKKWRFEERTNAGAPWLNAANAFHCNAYVCASDTCLRASMIVA